MLGRKAGFPSPDAREARLEALHAVMLRRERCFTFQGREAPMVD